MAKILVTGATGTVGSKLVKSLLEKKADVRIGVRSPDKARSLGLGEAEIVELDHDKPETVKAALAGVERLFILTPLSDGFVAQVSNLINEAKQAGVQFAVRLSGILAKDDALVFISRYHAACDKALADSGMGWSVLEAQFFQDNVINFSAATILGQGHYYGASETGKTGYVSATDIAEVAATILMDPGKHASQTYVITGPEALSDAEVAALVSDTLGKDVQYVNLTREQLKGGIMAAGVPEIVAKAVADFEETKSNGTAVLVTDHVSQILGRAPESYQAFLARSKDWWPSS